MEKYPIAIDTFREKIKNLVSSLIKKQNTIELLDEWLLSGLGALSDIPEGIIEIAKDCFDKYLTKEREQILYFFCLNIIYTIKHQFLLFPKQSIDLLIRYILQFIDIQIDDIRNWCDIGTDMWNDEPENNIQDCEECVRLIEIFNIKYNSGELISHDDNKYYTDLSGNNIEYECESCKKINKNCFYCTN